MAFARVTSTKKPPLESWSTKILKFSYRCIRFAADGRIASRRSLFRFSLATYLSRRGLRDGFRSSVRLGCAISLVAQAGPPPFHIQKSKGCGELSKVLCE